MKEKRGLDNRTTINLEELLENKEKKMIVEKVEKFNKKALKCENVRWKDTEPRVKTLWCKKINKGCHINRCPILNEVKD